MKARSLLRDALKIAITNLDKVYVELTFRDPADQITRQIEKAMDSIYVILIDYSATLPKSIGDPLELQVPSKYTAPPLNN